MGENDRKRVEKKVCMSGVVAVVQGRRIVKTTHLDHDNDGVVSMQGRREESCQYRVRLRSEAV